jgi:hypothetical protein
MTTPDCSDSCRRRVNLIPPRSTPMWLLTAPAPHRKSLRDQAGVTQPTSLTSSGPSSSLSVTSSGVVAAADNRVDHELLPVGCHLEVVGLIGHETLGADRKEPRRRARIERAVARPHRANLRASSSCQLRMMRTCGGSGASFGIPTRTRPSAAASRMPLGVGSLGKCAHVPSRSARRIGPHWSPRDFLSRLVR